MADVFNYLKPKAELSRNAFDLSQRHILSLKAGQRIPVMCLDTVPGDYFDINLLSLQRTFPVRTDAFARMSVNYDFVYVPYEQLYHGWNDFILQNREDFSSNTPPKDGVVPAVYLSDLLICICDYYIAELNNQPANYDDYWDTQAEYQFENLADMFGYSPAVNAVRMLDQLGYGSFYNLLELCELYKDRTQVIPYIIPRFGPTTLNPQTGNEDVPVKINLWRIAAYQKVCNDWYRNTQYTNANAKLFNLDMFVDSTGNIGLTNPVCVQATFRMLSHIWYCMYKRDMFTSLLPSPQFGDVSAVDLGSFTLSNQATDVSLRSAQVQPTSSSPNSNLLFRNSSSDPSPNHFLWTSSAQIDVYQLRKAEALQKWKEDRLRAGNKNRDISNVTFGRTSRYLADKYSDFITSFDGNMSIDEVLNTAASENFQLGDIGGKSVGSVQGHLKYETSEFGCLLCIMSVLPQSEYDAVGLDKNNTLLDPFDYFEPHFENLGFDAVYGYQLNGSLAVAEADVARISDLRKTLGYAPRYLNYKTAVDKVHGEFMSVGHVRLDSESSLETLNAPGSLVSWVTPRADLETFFEDTGVPQQFFYVNPSILDPIFASAVDSKLDTDQFLVNANFKISAVRNMSVLGLPRW